MDTPGCLSNIFRVLRENMFRFEDFFPGESFSLICVGIISLSNLRFFRGLGDKYDTNCNKFDCRSVQVLHLPVRFLLHSAYHRIQLYFTSKTCKNVFKHGPANPTATPFCFLGRAVARALISHFFCLSGVRSVSVIVSF